MMKGFHDNIKVYRGSIFSISEMGISTFPIITDYKEYLKGSMDSKSNYLLDTIARITTVFRSYNNLAKWAKRRHFYDKIKYINSHLIEMKIQYAHEFEIEYDKYALNFYENILDMAELIDTSSGRHSVDFKKES